MSKLREECRESDQVIDSIFKLKIIHVGEVAYMQFKSYWRIIWGNKRGGVSDVKTGSCAEVRRYGRKRSTTGGYGTGSSILGR
jgi:hypothetical protein